MVRYVVSLRNTRGGYPSCALLHRGDDRYRFYLGGDVQVAVFVSYQDAYNAKRWVLRNLKKYFPLFIKIHRLEEVVE